MKGAQPPFQEYWGGPSPPGSYAYASITKQIRSAICKRNLHGILVTAASLASTRSPETSSNDVEKGEAILQGLGNANARRELKSYRYGVPMKLNNCFYDKLRLK